MNLFLFLSFFFFLEIQICEPRSSEKGNYSCVITGSPLCFPGFLRGSPALTITTSGHNRRVFKKHFCECVCVCVCVCVAVENVLDPKGQVVSTLIYIDQSVSGCGLRVFKRRRDSRLSRCFCSLRGSRLKLCSDARRALRSWPYSSLIVFVAPESLLPFIQSTTWLELHLLTGSITSAMVEVCLGHAWQKKEKKTTKKQHSQQNPPLTPAWRKKIK